MSELTITPDITITDARGKSWASDTTVTAATANTTILIPSKGAEFLLAALDERIESLLGRRINYKISKMTIGDREFVAVGSADPAYYFGFGESELLSNLKS